MKNWEETVMSDAELLGFTDDLPIVAGSLASARKVFKARKYAKAQAEITWNIAFKAGYEAHVAEWNEGVLARGERAGIRIVVEFCEKNQMPDKPSSEPYPGLVIISKEKWQAFKKERGIKK